MRVSNNSNISNFLFNFSSNPQNQALNLDVPFAMHFDELKQRSLHLICLLVLFSSLAFFQIKPIVQFLEVPVSNLKFFQLSPGEYFLETVKIAFYTGIISIGPILLSQVTFFISPGLTFNEKKLVFPLILISVLLFFISITFAYWCLIPAALKFFIDYSSEVIEPLWSFTQYCDFILVLFFTTAISFQIPIFQIILGILGVVSGAEMLKIWKYVILFAVIIGAILTPSTDPITQILLSGAIIILYFFGAGILIFFKR